MVVTKAPNQAAYGNRWGIPSQANTAPTPIAMSTLLQIPIVTMTS